MASSDRLHIYGISSPLIQAGKKRVAEFKPSTGTAELHSLELWKAPEEVPDSSTGSHRLFSPEESGVVRIIGGSLASGPVFLSRSPAAVCFSSPHRLDIRSSYTTRSKDPFRRSQIRLLERVRGLCWSPLWGPCYLTANGTMLAGVAIPLAQTASTFKAIHSHMALQWVLTDDVWATSHLTSIHSWNVQNCPFYIDSACFFNQEFVPTFIPR